MPRLLLVFDSLLAFSKLCFTDNADSYLSFSELVVILPDYALRISLGTFSILLL